ncbi:MAG: Gfo/Idh/MocA family protein [Solirubrobacteraceae bacterium]
MPVQWGILSTARINDKFIVGCAQSELVTISAVASRDAGRARSYADERGIERAHGSYDALLADPEVEAVYISLPNSMHIDWTQRALRAGKHVLCEKPLSRHPDQVEAAFELAEREGLLLTEAFMYRHNPQTQRLRELVATGAIGRLRMVRAAFSFAIASDSDVRLSASLDGGALMDVGCYCVSTARLLAGEPLRVAAQQVVGGDGVDVMFVGTMSFADEVVAHFDAGLSLAARDELEAVGDRGTLFLDDPWHCRVPVIELRTGDSVKRIELPRVDSYMLEAENLSRAIRGEAAPLLGRDDAVGQAVAIDALYRAAADGGLVANSG